MKTNHVSLPPIYPQKSREQFNTERDDTSLSSSYSKGKNDQVSKQDPEKTPKRRGRTKN